MSKSTYKKWMTESYLYEASQDDDDYVSIGWGKYKEKDSVDDPTAPTFKKDDSGAFVPAKGTDKEKSKGDEEKPKDEPKKPMAISQTGGFGGDTGTDADFQGEPPEGAREPEGDDDTEISDSNSGPIDRDDIKDMLMKDPEIMDKLGDEDDVYWDDVDLVSSKYDDATIASVSGNMTLKDLKKQIMDYEEEQDESIKVINGKKYRPIKEEKKPKQHIFKEQYDRLFTNRIIL